MPDFQLRDGAYLLLLAMSVGEQVTVHDDRVVIPDPTTSGRFLAVGESDLDDLEAHGLLTSIGPGTEEGPVVTDRGRYWLKRWVTARFKVKGFEVTAVRASRMGDN